MHNFIKSDISIADSLTDVGSKLKSPKKEFFAKNKDRMEKLYINYNKKAKEDSLHTLESEWTLKTNDDKTTKDAIKKNREYAYGLYGSERPYVNKHWTTLTAKNGGLLYCPICGLNECEEMDHYVPRDHDQFPEYSAHLDNLIPICHSCNHKKSNNFLSKNGERLYFNAYYDSLTHRNILIGKITLSPIDGLPQIEVNVNPLLSKEKTPDKYILSTIDDLGLMRRFNKWAKLLLKNEMTRITARVGLSWEVMRDEMNKLSTPMDGNPDIVYPAVMGAIAQSTDMEAWYNKLLEIEI